MTETANITLADVAALLRYVSRSIAKKGQGISKKVSSNEELRKNINIITTEAEKFIADLPAKNLPEYTNLVNVFRVNDLDYYMPNSFKNQVAKRAQALFSEQQHREEVRELSYDQSAKILSDLTHFTGFNLVPIGLRLAESIPTRVSKRETGEEGETPS